MFEFSPLLCEGDYYTFCNYNNNEYLNDSEQNYDYIKQDFMIFLDIINKLFLDKKSLFIILKCL